MSSVPTVKTVVFSENDKNKKEAMIVWLKSRGMLSSTSESYVRKSS